MTYWLDYGIEQGYNKFRVKGDTDTEVIDKGLYKPGEVYIVGEDGWLYKTDDLSVLIQKYETKKATAELQRMETSQVSGTSSQDNQKS